MLVVDHAKATDKYIVVLMEEYHTLSADKKATAPHIIHPYYQIRN